jgi:hypothetical protein
MVTAILVRVNMIDEIPIIGVTGWTVKASSYTLLRENAGHFIKNLARAGSPRV